MVSISLPSRKTILQSITVLLSISVVSLPQLSDAAHAQEISISLDSALFVPLTGGGNQINIFVQYIVNEPSIINQMINSVMKIYKTDRTLVKTSSSDEGFIANQTGLQRHATTITNSSLHDLIAVVQFTDLAKTIPLSNPLKVDLTLNQTGAP